MAKKQISTYKFVPGAVPPAYNQYPKAVALLTANKNFLVEEMNAYILAQIAANVSNSGSIYYNFSYDSTRSSKCKRDIRYFLDAIIYDLTYGGNSLSYQIASRYYLAGTIQILTPAVEVDVQTWLRGKITTNILTNTTYTRLNSTVTQTTITGNAGESGSTTRATTLANIIINVIGTGLSSLPTPVAPDSQTGGLLPNAVVILEANKRFIQEETIAYIAYNSANNISPYVYYTYNAAKCRRDVSYILEGYITDLKHGGNRQTVFNASYYWLGGVAQVDGDRQPEVYAHTFIKNLIQNFIFENTAFSSLQSEAAQVINNSLLPESVADTRISELVGTVVDVINVGLDALPAKISNRGYVKFPGFYKLKDILLITNTSRNVILYNFADPTYKAEVTYSEDFDVDFPAALYGNDRVTTITFDIPTTNHMVTDNIQIFVEAKEQAVRMNEAGRDAMERMKVGIPQSMLDADFEYGLQPTKWQAISFMRGYPSIYEIPGSDTPVVSVVTDASTGNAISGLGASLITVTTVSAHGFVVGSPITIKALANSISGFSRAEGTFLVNSVPSSNTFTYYSKSKVGTSNNQQLSSTYTQLRKAGYYTGSALQNATFNVYSSGSSGSITTSLVTPSGVDVIAFTGTAPPIGAPITGTGIDVGAQVTAVVGAAGATTTLTTTANIGSNALVVDNTTGINAGMIVDRGDGVGVQITDITGNTVTINGALTSQIIGSTQSYTGVSGSGGSGTGAVFTISRSSGVYLATVTDPGNGYTATNTLTIAGTSLGGASPANSATVTVVSASAKNTVSTFNIATLTSHSPYTVSTGLVTTGGTGTGATVNVTLDANNLITAVGVNAPGSGYTAGDTLLLVSGLTRGAVTSTFSASAGSLYTTSTNNATTGGTGTGLTIDVTADVAGGAVTSTLINGGSGYTNGSNVNATGGSGTGLQFYSVTTSGGIVTAVSVGSKGSGYAVNDVVTISGGGANATVRINSITNRGILSAQVNQAGSGYTIGDTIAVSGGTGGTLTIGNVTKDAFINIASINAGGIIQSVSVAGTPITSPSKSFLGALTMSAVTTAQVSSGTTLTYSAIATIEASFPAPHGFIPGDTVTIQITSGDTGSQLAAGAYFVEQVPSLTSFRYTARTAGTIVNTLAGVVYARPDSFFIHRPFDGGVQLGTASPSHGAGAVRMSKKYIRYQSGKGVMYNTGALFAPSYDIQNITASGTAIGSTITITTDDTDHGCQVGATISISGVKTSGYNGTYVVTDIVTERILRVLAVKTLGATTTILGNPCQLSIRTWHGSTVRSGIFDEQNGMFWQYDGMKMAVGRRSATFQLAGTISVPSGSNSVTGSNTRFRQQLTAGDRIVIRGMTHVVTQIIDDTTLSITPNYRGVLDGVNIKSVKIQDIIIPQEQWNLDTCDGSGPSGYNLDVTKMQMIGIQHTWYGAGFIDFMLRGPEGNYIWCHRFRNSNVNTEAYMRSGNQPVRYEVLNEGARDRLTADMDSTQTTLSISSTYWFPTSGTVIVDGEMMRYTGKTDTQLVGLTRSAQTIVFQAGSQRNFTGTTATTHTSGSGVILISNTITPNISHWGSAFMIDGQFDSDRGYIFNYAATAITASVDKTTAFLIRLAPSVSNAQTGDLGEKELLNRAQLLLSSIAMASDSVAGGGSLVVEGVLNPINYPVDPTKITWTGLNSQAAGGQPSFAQIALGGSVTWSGNASTATATIQGAFTTTLTAKSFAASNVVITARATNTTTYTVVARGGLQGLFGVNYTNAQSTLRNDIIITNADYTNYIAQNTMSIGDPVASTIGGLAGGTTITGITFGYAGTSYTRILLSNFPTTNGGANSTVNMTFTNSLSTTFNTAISTARTDFIVANADYTTAIKQGDVLSAGSNIAGGQTVSSFVQSYMIVAGATYARVVMSGLGSVTSTSGAGNNVAVTATSALTATYGRALSTARLDFLITDSEYDSSGIAVGDTLSVATYITGSQTINTITRAYANINSVSYTRIIMSAAANSSSTSGVSNDITITNTAAGSAASYVRTNYLFFTKTSFDASGATLSTKIASDQTAFPAGTSISAITTRTFGATTVYRVTLTQSSNTTLNAAGTLKFQFGAQYALPGEQVFSFVSNPGSTDTLSLEELKELTSTAIGGRGTFPNGPDVLAINVYKVSGTSTVANLILRWGEAQA
jgi:hypothetical protein